MSHTCQCFVEKGLLDEQGYAAEAFVCGDPANKKVGICWTCDFHFKMFIDFSEDVEDTKLYDGTKIIDRE